MPTETDLPCADCDGTLTRRGHSTDELPGTPMDAGQVTVAVCSGCGARYYPERTLETLANHRHQ